MGDRTPDLRNAIATLSQLSYDPTICASRRCFFPLQTGKRHRSARYLMIFFLGPGLDAEPFLASLQIDLVIGRGLFILVGS